MSFYRLFYHFVWGTKERLPLIEPGFERELYRVMVSKVVEFEGIVHALGGTQDHVHLAATFPPKYSISRFIGEVKGSGSHYINHVIEPGFLFRWQEEYGVLSFAEKNLPAIVRYINNQKKHHAEGSLQPMLELAP